MRQQACGRSVQGTGEGAALSKRTAVMKKEHGRMEVRTGNSFQGSGNAPYPGKLTPGKVYLGTYQVIRKIGEGTVGDVYLGRHLRLGKTIVIKEIKSEYVSQLAPEDLKREADILKNLKNRYITQVYDFVQNGSDVYTVMDYVDGNSMQEYIDRRVRFKEADIVRFLRESLEALDYLHTRRPPVVHRDIKPANIMIDRNGDVCLIDFNISLRANMENEMSGYTEGYASPEQVYQGELYDRGGDYMSVRIDGRSDIYSLGASFLRLMTGQKVRDIKARRQRVWQVPGNIYSEQLCRVIDRAIEDDPGKRFQSAADMRRALDTMWLRDREYRSLRRGQTIYTTVFLIAFAAGVFLFLYGASQRKAEEFQSRYSSLKELTEENNYDDVISEGADILNDKDYARILSRNPQEEADIYYMIADSYFSQDDYNDAVTFYKKAVDLGTDNSDCYRDLAIAFARNGQTDEAEKIIAKAEQYGLGSADIKLVDAEIDYGKENYEDAEDEFRKAADLSGDDEDLHFRALYYLAKTYEKEGDYESEIDTLEEALKAVGEKYQMPLLRKEGAAYYSILKKDGELSDTDTRKAYDIYQKLVNDSGQTLEDWTNFATLLLAKEDYDSAAKILDKAAEKYRSAYQIPAKMALVELYRQSALPSEDQDYSKFDEAYHRAEKLFADKKQAGESDEDMQTIEKEHQKLLDAKRVYS
jgi:serine/threonine-protein kinase